MIKNLLGIPSGQAEKIKIVIETKTKMTIGIVGDDAVVIGINGRHDGKPRKT